MAKPLTRYEVDQFVSPEEDDESARLQHGHLRSIPLFCALGWDHGALPFPHQMTLSAVASLEYKASLGRPLFASRYRAGLDLPDKEERRELLKWLVSFAAQQLIRIKVRPDWLNFDQKLTCLSARLPIEFMSSTPTQAEKDQVFSVHQGDRGELIAMLLIIVARDAIVSSYSDDFLDVVPFLEKLIFQPTESSGDFCQVLDIKSSVFRGPEDRVIPLKAASCDVKLYFNHFIKRQQRDNLSEEVLGKLIARCAAILGADGQYGFALIVPTVKGDEEDEVNKGSQGLIMW
ncbi:hypothetical protein D9757_003993 [Collybiopsis confluens]|uniref:Uncharacterized protein n=1 Tax=Collybiopsis confluens TaxID=2823264 RepID=A0A8H5HXM7_9AGAR|nr:hypothetical protein D9757_003993 [Collybiopsis confluens]